jgi:outer membrane protein TolC
MKRAPILIIILLCLGFLSKGQNSSMNLEEAISIGLKNNFSILISGNDTKIAANNNSLGNAGFLPVIGVTGGIRENIASGTTKDQNGVATVNNNQRTGTANLGATLDWTLFNGFEMFIKKERLSSLQTLQETTMRATVENTVSEIITSYFAVVQLKNSLQVLQNAIDFSNSRYELTRKKLQIGTTSELAFLKSSTDLNADSAAFLRQKVALANAKSKLNTLLVQDPEKDFDVSTIIQFDKVLDYNGIKEGLPTINSQISLAKQSADISLLDYRLTNAPKYPQIGFFTDFNWSKNNYNFGTSSSILSSGPVVGLSFSMPVFDGFNKKRITENARISVETLKLDYESVIKSTQASLWQVYNEYKNNLNLVRLETANLEVAQHTAKISFESFRVGQMSDYELRQIQLSALEAENSLIVAQFQAKKSETELLRLSGKLIQAK